jgi:hypothetical protein
LTKTIEGENIKVFGFAPFDVESGALFFDISDLANLVVSLDITFIHHPLMNV